MLQTILVPLDGSEESEGVLPFAMTLSRRAHGRLVLMQAVPEALTGGRPRVALGALADAVSPIGVAASSHYHPLRGDDHRAIAHAIVEAANEEGADLIALSSRGRTGMEHWLRDSVPAHVLRHTSVPILLIPAGCSHFWPTDRPLRVLIPLDGTVASEGVLNAASMCAEALDAEILLLRVVPSHYSLAGSSPYLIANSEEEIAGTRLYLEYVAGSLRLAGRHVTIAAELGMPARTVGNVAHGQQADVIALHESNSVTNVVLDSVVTGTLQWASLPLLIVPVGKPSAVAAAAR